MGSLLAGLLVGENTKGRRREEWALVGENAKLSSPASPARIFPARAFVLSRAYK